MAGTRSKTTSSKRSSQTASNADKSRSDKTRSEKTRSEKARSEKPTSDKPKARAESAERTVARRRSAGSSPSGLGALLGRVRPVFLLGGVLGSIYTCVALATYDPLDPSWSRASGSTVSNAAGPVGAYLSDLLFQVLGYGAWSIALVGVVLALRLARRQVGGFGRAFAGTAMAWALLCVVALLMPAAPGADFPPGGLLGEISVGNLEGLVGPAGTWILLVGVILGCVPFVAPVHLEDLAARLVGGVEGAAPQVGRVGLNLGKAAVGGVAAAGAAVADRVREARAGDGDEEYDEDEDYPEASSGPWRDEVSEAIERSVARPEADLDEHAPATAWRDGGAPPPRPAAGLASLSGEEEPSAVATPTQASGRALVEAVWEPTLPPEEEERDTIPAAALARGGAPLDLAALAARAEEAPEPASLHAATPSAVDVPSASALRSVHAPAPSSFDVRPDVRPSVHGESSAVQRPVPPPPAVRATVTPQALPPEPMVAEVARPTHGAPTHRPSVLEDDDDASSAVDAPDPASLHGVPSIPRKPGAAPASSGGPRRAVAVTPGALVSGGNVDVDLIAEASGSRFELPHLGLLDQHERDVAKFDEIELQALAQVLEEKLGDFGVKGEVVAIRPGPVVTTFEYLPAPGIKISKISGLSDDIAMALKAIRVRIVAPIPGKGVVGIEIPNKKRQTVWIRDMLASETFRKQRGVLPMSMGKTVEGKTYIADLAKMPHLLVGGTTGSGKSVGVNAMLLTMLYTRTPEELKLILIDPKMLEFELYKDIPHLLHPVVTEPKLASAALRWACTEMDERYRTLSRWGVRNISSFNKKVEQELENWTPEKAWRYAPADHPPHETPPRPKMMPYIVIVIDELADLMMVAAKDVEESIIRIAQKARAAGIHLIVATQRPSVNVITGLIKANMPSRVAFQVRTKVDGRTILDQNGAENLLGKGDMLFLPPGVSALERIHGPFVSDEEVRAVTDFLREQGSPVYEAQITADDEEAEVPLEEGEYDDLYDLAVAYVCRQGKASASMIQREFRIGYNRAARILEIMEREGVVGPADGARPREVLVQSHAM